ncbi:hypothetical protein [Ignatzschineria indica]|nr:hypothetical protein [Ignatzschineria indica]
MRCRISLSRSFRSCVPAMSIIDADHGKEGNGRFSPFNKPLKNE